jgi:hypothetical protein
LGVREYQKVEKPWSTSLGECGVVHTVAHTTPVREDLGSNLHIQETRDGIYLEALISLLSDNRLKK